MRVWWPRRSRVGHDDAAAFVDGGLPPPMRDAFAHHLALCSQCQASVEEHRLTKALLGALPPVALPRSFVLTPQRAATPRPIRTVRVPLWRDLAGARLAVAVSTLTAAAMLGAVLVDFRDGSSVQSADGGGVNAAPAVAQFDTEAALGAPPQPVATSLELIDSAPAPVPAPPSSTAPVAESLPDETDLSVAAVPEEADPPPAVESAPLAVPGGGGESEREALPPDQSTETLDAEGTVLVAAAEPEQSLPPSEAPDAEAGSPQPEDSALDPDAAADGQDVTEPEDAAEAADAPAEGDPPESVGDAVVTQEFDPAEQAGADAAPAETAEPPTPAGDAEDLSTVASTSDAENVTDASTADAPTPELDVVASTEGEPQDTAVDVPDEIEAVEEVVAAAGLGAIDDAADAGDTASALDAEPVAPPSDEAVPRTAGVDAAPPEDATLAEAPPAEVQPLAEGRQQSVVSLEPQGTAQDRVPLARSVGAESDRPWLLPLEIALGVITVLALALALWLHRRALPG